MQGWLEKIDLSGYLDVRQYFGNAKPHWTHTSINNPFYFFSRWLKTTSESLCSTKMWLQSRVLLFSTAPINTWILYPTRRLPSTITWNSYTSTLNHLSLGELTASTSDTMEPLTLTHSTEASTGVTTTITINWGEIWKI